ncbi:MAG: cysteine desulfurase NifS [Deltaproteobacteria bacterium]|nr:MAG: cysteine desulfurase NifS [Deltaproteobacteria bacterium]
MITAIYFDHSATTPIRREVIDAMDPYFAHRFGNASNIHRFGQQARKDLEDARKQVADIIGSGFGEIIFTSGGTESDNLAVQGVVRARKREKNHIVTSSIEHPAVLNTCRFLEQQGTAVDYLPVDTDGVVDPRTVEAAIRPDTALVSIMLANNEVGTLQPIREIGVITRARGIPLHADAVQAMGKIPVNVDDLNVDLLSISGHKIYGPKGIGCLYIRKGTPFAPLFFGGHHERGYRPGTENVAAIIGLARALELADAEREGFAADMHHLRTMLETGIREKIPAARFNGHTEKRLPNIANISFQSMDGETLLYVLDSRNIAVSTGAACASGSADVSHVLTAMGLSPALARGSLRFSLGRLNDENDIQQVLNVLPGIIDGLRQGEAKK